MDRKSQNQKIGEWLLAGKTINPLQALEKFGCFRLGARIHDLKAGGMQIVTERVTDKKSGKFWAEYKIAK